jgi:hypothetical protein
MVLVLKETGRIWILPNEQLWREVLAAHHDGQITGHLGMSRTLELVGRKYWWEEIVAFTKRYMEGCHTCAHNKVCNKKPGGLLQPLPILEGLWLWTQSDFIIELPPSKGYNAIYVIADCLTKMAHFLFPAKLPAPLKSWLNYTYNKSGHYTVSQCNITPIMEHSLLPLTCITYTKPWH